MYFSDCDRYPTLFNCNKWIAEFSLPVVPIIQVCLKTVRLSPEAVWFEIPKKKVTRRVADIQGGRCLSHIQRRWLISTIDCRYPISHTMCQPLKIHQTLPFLHSISLHLRHLPLPTLFDRKRRQLDHWRSLVRTTRHHLHHLRLRSRLLQLWRHGRKLECRFALVRAPSYHFRVPTRSGCGRRGGRGRRRWSGHGRLWCYWR